MGTTRGTQQLSCVPFGQLSCPFKNLQGNCVPAVFQKIHATILWPEFELKPSGPIPLQIFKWERKLAENTVRHAFCYAQKFRLIFLQDASASAEHIPIQGTKTLIQLDILFQLEKSNLCFPSLSLSIPLPPPPPRGDREEGECIFQFLNLFL